MRMRREEVGGGGRCRIKRNGENSCYYNVGIILYRSTADKNSVYLIEQ